MSSCASDDQGRLIATELGPIPQPAMRAPLPAPDPARGEAVAWLKNHYLYANDLDQARLRDLIMIPLFEDYIRENGLEPTQAQITSFHRHRKDLHAEPTAFHPPNSSLVDRAFDVLVGAAARRTVAQVMIRQWLLDKSLYEKYGGRVIFQQANPNEPVGAYRAFLADHERRGTFRIFDTQRRDEFWSYFTKQHSMELTKDQIDFSKPWWEKPPGPD